MDEQQANYPARKIYAAAAAALLLAALGGAFIYNGESSDLRAAKYRELNEISIAKAAGIAAWRGRRLTDAELNSSGLLRERGLAWLGSPGDAAARTALLARMRELRGEEGYQDLILASRDGRTLLSLEKEPARLSEETRRLAAAAAAAGKPLLGDIHFCRACGRLHLDAAAPVKDAAGRAAAVLVLRSAPESSLYPLIEDWPLPNRSAEVQLFRRDGDSVRLLNRLKYSKAAPLSVRVPVSSADTAAANVAAGRTGVFEGRDYRGVRVLADLQPVPGSPWYLVAKMDEDEILSEVRLHGYFLLGLVALIALVIAGSLYLYLNVRQAMVYKRLWRSETEKRAVEEEIKATLYGIGDGIISTDAEGRVARMNPVAEQLTGWKEAEALGRPVSEVFRIINEETGAAVEVPVERVLREGGIVGLANHTLLIGRDGARRPIADSGAPVRDADGRIIGVVLVFRDQSEERAMLKKLEASEERYRQLFAGMSEGFALHEIVLGKEGRPEDYRFLEVNPAFERLTGLKKEELLGRTVLEAMPATEKRWIEAYGRVALTGEPLVIENFSGALGRYYSVKAFSPRRGQFAVTFSDVTDRRRAEEAARAEQRGLDAVFAASPAGLVVLDGAGNVTRINAAAAAIAGAEIGEIPHEQIGGALGCANSAVDPRGCGYSPDCKFCQLRRALEGLLAGGGSMKGMELHLKLQGRAEPEVWLLAGAEPIELEGRRQVVVSLSDITELKSARALEEKSRARYAAIFGQSPIAIEYYDEEGHMVGANEACIDLFGVLDISEIAGADLFKDPNVTEEVKARLLKGETVRVEAPFDFDKVKASKLYRTSRSGKLTLDYIIAPMLERGRKSGYVVQIQDVSLRKAAETESRRRNELLTLINSSGDLYGLLRRVSERLRDWSGCEAVGVRLKDGDDFPYFETRGFPAEFVRAESSLCAVGPDGKPLKDASGNPVLECMCGNVLQGHFDPALPFFTKKGSFWTNSTTELLASTTEADRQARTRNRCNGEGYESVALIQLRAGIEVLGLLQLNSREKGRFDRELIGFLEYAADQLGVAVSHLKAQEALRRSEVRLKKAQSTASVGNWEIYFSTGEVWASEEARRIYGLPPEGRLTVEDIKGIPLPAYRPALDRAMKELAEGRGDYDLEFEIRAGVGGTRWVHSRAELVLDENAQPVAAGVIQDITAAKLAEAELRARERKFSEFFRNMTSGVAMYIPVDGGEDFFFADINPAGERMSRVKREEVVGRRLKEIFPEVERMGFFGLLKEVWRTGRPAYLPDTLYKDGRISQWVENRIVKLPSGEVVAIYDDITERRRLEAERLELMNTVEKALDEIYVFDGETLRFEYLNSGALRNIGYTMAEMKGLTPVDIKPEFTEGTFREKLRPLLDGTRDELTFETVHRRKDGTVYPAEVHLQYSPGAGGGKFSAFIMDITERKAAEDRIKASLAEKEVLLKEIHHRVKNNLQVVSSLLNLQSRNIKDEAALGVFKDSRARVRAMALVHEILYRSQDFSSMNMRDYVSKLLDSLSATYRSGAAVKLEKDVCDCSLDIDVAVSLGLILNELVSNAIKHAGAEGRPVEVKVSLDRAEGGYRLTVEDDGPGLPPGFDLKKAGSLGLQLVATLAGQISGRVEAGSGGGARFTVSFPG